MGYLVELLSASPNITELVVEEDLTLERVQVLARLLEDPTYCYLRSLHLDNCGNSVAGATIARRIMEALAGNQTVTKLTLTHHWEAAPNAMHSRGDAIAQLLAVNSTIVELRLPRQNLNDVDMTRISPVLATGNRSLRLLDLSQNRLGDVGGSEIAHILSHNDRLTSLDLSHCQISSGGMGCIATALRHKNTALLHLYLNGNAIQRETSSALRLRLALNDNTTLHTMDGIHYAGPLLLRNAEIRAFRTFRCRATIIALLGMKRRRPPHMPLLAGDVLRYIGKLVKAQALDPSWGKPPARQRNKRVKNAAAADADDVDLLVDRE